MSIGRQAAFVDYLQGTSSGGATVNGNGIPLETAGMNGTIMIEVRETAGGTCTLSFQGSYDGTNWYQVGYYQVDNNATLSRAVANVSVTANMKHVYQLLDAYPLVQAVVSSVAGGCIVTVRGYCLPL